MNKIYKVAKSFQQKLALASVGNLQNLKLVYQSADKLGRILKNLWMTADKDPYSDFNSDIGKAVEKIARIARNAYQQVLTHGMPATGNFGYAGFLNNMNIAIRDLENLGPFPSIDPSAINSLSDLKKNLHKAESEFVPVGIPRQQKAVIMPEDKITAKQTSQPLGAAYTMPDEGIEDEVNLISRPAKNYSGEFTTQ